MKVTKAVVEYVDFPNAIYLSYVIYNCTLSKKESHEKGGWVSFPNAIYLSYVIYELLHMNVIYLVHTAQCTLPIK